jgi:competence protein ComEC
VGPPDGRVVDRVRALGVRRIDGIILTHDSLDHRGGFDAAYAALHPRWVAMPASAPGPWERIRKRAGNVVELCAGSMLELGAARIDVLHPRCDGRVEPHTGDLHNDGAMVLLVRHGAVSALLPADAEAPVLLGLGLPRIDLLRIAHHGSRDADLPDLLARTTPQVAAISVGEGNDYGHPNPGVLASLEAAGTKTFRTDRDGNVAFDSDGRVLRLVDG